MDGNFYGTTEGGGARGYGTVFKVTPAGALTTLYAFTGGNDGSGPNALVQGSDGNFYGTTASNTIRGLAFYGTIFRIAPNGAFTTLYSLNPLFGDGAYPFAGLIQGTDGNFYGTTSHGGTNSDGTVFGITPNGVFSTLLSFDGFDDGAIPLTALAEGQDGSLYGTTSTGGPGGHGTVFELTFTSAPQITMPLSSQTALVGATVTFSVAVFGAPPLSYQWQENGTNLTDGLDPAGSRPRRLPFPHTDPHQRVPRKRRNLFCDRQQCARFGHERRRESRRRLPAAISIRNALQRYPHSHLDRHAGGNVSTAIQIRIELRQVEQFGQRCSRCNRNHDCH
jgi:uncharacterized repeat protein (TIGR03803 family)